MVTGVMYIVGGECLLHRITDIQISNIISPGGSFITNAIGIGYERPSRAAQAEGIFVLENCDNRLLLNTYCLLL